MSETTGRAEQTLKSHPNHLPTASHDIGVNSDGGGGCGGRSRGKDAKAVGRGAVVGQHVEARPVKAPHWYLASTAAVNQDGIHAAKYAEGRKSDNQKMADDESEDETGGGEHAEAVDAANERRGKRWEAGNREDETEGDRCDDNIEEDGRGRGKRTSGRRGEKRRGGEEMATTKTQIRAQNTASWH
jgi:hypothetical protein